MQKLSNQPRRDQVHIKPFRQLICMCFFLLQVDDGEKYEARVRGREQGSRVAGGLVRRMAGLVSWTITSTITSTSSSPQTQTILTTVTSATSLEGFNVTHNDTGEWFPGEHSRYSALEAVAIALVLACIIIGTVIGNILVCVAVCLVKKLRRPYNYLIVSLAVSDICVALLVMPLATAYEIIGVWTFGPVMCNVWVSFDVLSCTASILNLCMISVDRYNAITKPLQYCVKRTSKRMMIWVSLVWLGAACISLPPLLILGNKHEVEKDGTVTTECIVCQDPIYQIYATLGSFYIPLTVMLLVYYKIFCAARRIEKKERLSRSHMEAHCYLEINVRNGGAKVGAGGAGGAESPAAFSTKPHQHRSSTTSTITTVSLLYFFILFKKFRDPRTFLVLAETIYIAVTTLATENFAGVGVRAQHLDCESPLHNRRPVLSLLLAVLAVEWTVL